MVLETVDRLPMAIPPVLEDIEGDDKHQYIPVVNDHHEGEGVMMAPHSVLRMR